MATFNQDRILQRWTQAQLDILHDVIKNFKTKYFLNDNNEDKVNLIKKMLEDIGNVVYVLL